MAKPKILLWDIETGYNEMLGFDLGGKFGTGIPYKNVKKERYVISAAWRWLGEKKVHGVALTDFPRLFKKDPHDDRKVVKTLVDVMYEADAIIAHYGDEFDWKYFHGRCALNHIAPPNPPVKIDTYKMAKKIGRFNSYRLDYLCMASGGPRKNKNEWDWWLEAHEGKADSVNKIYTYNKQDIICLEWVYNWLQGYDQSKVNMRLWTGKPVCRNCGKESVIFRGHYMTKEGMRHKMQCMAEGCGAWDNISPSALKKQFPEIYKRLYK